MFPDLFRISLRKCLTVLGAPPSYNPSGHLEFGSQVRNLQPFVSGASDRPLTPILLKSIAIDLPFLLLCFCKTVPSFWPKVVCTPPICITIRLPFVSRYFYRSIRVRGRWSTPHLGGKSKTNKKPSQHEKIHAHPFVLGPELGVRYTYTYAKHSEHISHPFLRNCAYDRYKYTSVILKVFLAIEFEFTANTHTS